MTFLSGQDDFFQTANQPISVRNLFKPYNNISYCPSLRAFFFFRRFFNTYTSTLSQVHLIMYSRAITELLTAVHQRKPSQKR